MSSRRGDVDGLDLEAARAWLRAHLPKGEPVELRDPVVVERAASVIRGAALPSPKSNRKRARKRVA